ncbi:MAG: hypothetical protein ACRDPZ_01700 [Gaiellaceae bacterium]
MPCSRSARPAFACGLTGAVVAFVAILARSAAVGVFTALVPFLYVAVVVLDELLVGVDEHGSAHLRSASAQAPPPAGL